LNRVAPIGLAYPDAERAFVLGCESAAITHGHRTGCLSAGFLASLISRIVSGEPLVGAVSDATRSLMTRKGHDECLNAVERAVKKSSNPGASAEVIESLGTGRGAEEALAIGLYSALVAGDDFRKGVLSSVNHSGDSDATGSITGSIVGALYGDDVIPKGMVVRSRDEGCGRRGRHRPI